MLSSILESRPNFAAFACLAVLCLLAYANSFDNGFVFDDEKLVVENRFVQNFEITKLFTEGYWAGAELGDNPPPDMGGVYRPLVLLSYALNHLAGGLNPFGYHLVNLAIHLLVSFLVYLLAFQLGCSRTGALVGASLFALHPIHTEAVTAIYGRPELLMSLGLLGGLSSYIAAVNAESEAAGALRQRRRLLMAASLGSFAVGLLSKEQALVLPALVVIYDLGASRGPAIRRFFRFLIPRYAPYLVVFLLYMAARIAVLGVSVPAGEGIPFINNPLAYVSLPERLMTAAAIAGKYLWLCVWPAQLSVDYSFNSIPIVSSALDFGFLVSVLAWLLLIALLAWSYIKRARLVLIATSLMILTFFPASNLLVVIGTIMGERLFYLPSVGLALLAAGGWDGLRAHASASRWVYHSISAGLVAAMLLLTARTLVRNRDWQSNETLLRSAALVVPGNAKIQHNLGILERDPEKALKYLAKSREIYPDYVKTIPQVAFQEGLILLRSDRLDEAVELLELAARQKPKLKGLLFNLGVAYMNQGRWQDAEVAYRKAIVLNSSDMRIYNNLSFVLWKQDRYAEALEAADSAARLNWNFSEAHYNRGAALEAMGRLKDAALAYEQAFELKPTSSVRQRLDKVREQLGMNGASRSRK